MQNRYDAIVEVLCFCLQVGSHLNPYLRIRDYDLVSRKSNELNSLCF